MTLFKRYVHHLMIARGLEHFLAVSVLRDYIKNTPEMMLREELDGLTTLTEMRAVAEAGVAKKIWDTYVAKLRTML